MLRLTKQTDYGIVLLVRFAREADRQTLTARDLAEEAHLPLPMVSKILKLLARGGLLASHRGAKGGYSLTRTPESISVAEVITTLEGPVAITECSQGPAGSCSMEAYCEVMNNWQRINLVIHQALEGVSLAQMAAPTPPPVLGNVVPLQHLMHDEGDCH